MILHRLKIKEIFWKRIRSSVKPFEVRLNDRDYQVGDYIMFLTECGKLPRHSDPYSIPYIHTELGMKEGYVVLSLKKAER